MFNISSSWTQSQLALTLGTVPNSLLPSVPSMKDFADFRSRSLVASLHNNLPWHTWHCLGPLKAGSVERLMTGGAIEFSCLLARRLHSLRNLMMLLLLVSCYEKWALVSDTVYQASQTPRIKYTNIQVPLSFTGPLALLKHYTSQSQSCHLCNKDVILQQAKHNQRGLTLILDWFKLVL